MTTPNPEVARQNAEQYNAFTDQIRSATDVWTADPETARQMDLVHAAGHINEVARVQAGNANIAFAKMRPMAEPVAASVSPSCRVCGSSGHVMHETSVYR